MYIHNSLNSEKFKSDKKLQLMRQGIINIDQFIALLDDKDPYILIGPAVIDREFVDQFMNESIEYHAGDAEETSTKYNNYTNIQLVEMLLHLLPIVKKHIPEIERSLEVMFNQIANSKCQTCVIVRYIGMFINMTSVYVYDGRDNTEYINDYENIKSVIDKSKPNDKINSIISKMDNAWIAPENMLKLGDDLVDGIQSCLDCVIKHLERSKILYNEMIQGYPNYKDILSNEMKKSVDIYEAFYLKYWDVLGELDMASNEMVGDIKSLNGHKLVGEIINQANVIRKERIDFMMHQRTPHFSKLMLDVKKLQLTVLSILNNE